MANGDKADTKKDLSREEDYRDFEQRDIENGWPYDDGAGAASRPVGNGAYGETGANFDRERNGGYRVTNVDADGGQAPLVSPVLPETDHRENSDQLEADVAAALEDLPDLLLNALDGLGQRTFLQLHKAAGRPHRLPRLRNRSQIHAQFAVKVPKRLLNIHQISRSQRILDALVVGALGVPTGR